MGVKVHKIFNAGVWLNGNQHLGEATEITLPELTATMSEHTALGMFGKTEYPSGLEMMECTIKWNSFYAESAAVVMGFTTTFDLQVRTTLEKRTSNGLELVQLVYTMRAQSKGYNYGAIKPQEATEHDNVLTVYALKMEEDGVSKFDYDVESNTLTVNGVDQLAGFRANL